MRENNIIKSVSFNTTKPDDVKMLKAVKRKRNFSGYIKKLIMEDIVAKEFTDEQKKLEVSSISQSHEEAPSSADRMRQIKEQIKKASEEASQNNINRQ